MNEILLEVENGSTLEDSLNTLQQMGREKPHEEGLFSCVGCMSACSVTI